MPVYSNAFRYPFATAAVLMSICVSPVRLEAQTAPALVDYNREVHGLLAARCLVCHSQEKRSGGLSLGTYEDILNGGRSGAALKPGKSAESLMVQRMTGPPTTRMPLGGPALTPAEIGIITSWIDQGARPAPLPPRQNRSGSRRSPSPVPKLPASPWKDWDGPLDRYTAAYLASHGVNEPQLVPDAVFARRAWLDVWGLLAYPEELRAFLDDRDPAKRRHLVDTLLSGDRKYAENWISYWNDLLRNEEGVSYYSETGGRRSITAWLLSALECQHPLRRVDP